MEVKYMYFITCFQKIDEDNYGLSEGGFYPIEEPKEFEHYTNIALG